MLGNFVGPKINLYFVSETEREKLMCIGNAGEDIDPDEEQVGFLK